MISDGQAIVLGLLQGGAELFPVSSLGHSVIAPRLLGWDIHQSDDFFLTFLVATHLATALVLVGFFWRDWVRIVRGLARTLAARRLNPDDSDAKLGWMIVVATIPAGLLGLAFEHPLRAVFGSPLAASIFLFGNGLLLLAAERMRQSAPGKQRQAFSDERIAHTVGPGRAAAIGAAQALALLPGFSRSGAAMAGGLRAGLSNEDAARFSFLLATPVIGAAALLKLPDLFGRQGDGLRGPALIGALCAGATAYVSVRFLVRYFETNRLTPFAYYCLAAGALCTIAIAVT
jgi:undecaprenyl-diphosphatase